MIVMRLCIRLLCVMTVAMAGLAADWPGWRGPDRTGVSPETGLLQTWPPEGPRLVWKVAGLGEGYAAPSVVGGKVFVMGTKGNDEYVIALTVEDGKQLWSTKIGIIGKNDGPNYPGPRSTPTIDNELLYTLGSDGDLVCLRAATGKIIWHKHLEKEFEGNRGTWAYTESVLIDGDVLVCTPGGPSAVLVALNKKTGGVIWKAQVPDGNQAGYSSAIIARAGPVKQYVQFLGPGVVGFDAKDGRFLWEYTKNAGGVSATTPIFHDGCVFSSASGVAGDAGGDALLRLTFDNGKPGLKEVYYKRNLNNFHGGVVRVGEHLYGTNNTGLVCLDFKTGERQWRERCVGQGSLLAADGHLYIRGTQGEVALVAVNPHKYVEKGRFTQPFRSRFATFTHPALAGGRLYLRDADVMLCYDVKK
jgi:outer membrane protein assembly factor BamB